MAYIGGRVFENSAEEVLWRDPLWPMVDLSYSYGDMNHYLLIHYRPTRRLIRRRD